MAGFYLCPRTEKWPDIQFHGEVIFYFELDFVSKYYQVLQTWTHLLTLIPPALPVAAPEFLNGGGGGGKWGTMWCMQNTDKPPPRDIYLGASRAKAKCLGGKWPLSTPGIATTPPPPPTACL